MIEKPKLTIETHDIRLPKLSKGESAIVLQRHGKYERDKTNANSGSLTKDAAEGLTTQDQAFFNELLSDEQSPEDIMVLFIASDTKYSNGYRSMETAQIAEDAAINAFRAVGLDPRQQIVNLNQDFKINTFEQTGQSIRPDAKIREPEFLNNTQYVQFLKDQYGDGLDLTPRAWAMHEMDADKEAREQLGAEGIYDVVDRTKKSLAIMERYAKVFHANNPGKKLIIWTVSHYDTISPLAKESTGTNFGDYLPVDYGAGITIELKADQTPVFELAGKKIALNLGSAATRAIESRQ